MLLESIFYDSEFDLENFIEQHLTSNDLNGIREELEVHYKRVRKNAIAMTGTVLDTFLRATPNNQTEPLECLLAELDLLKDQFTERLETLNNEHVKFSSLAENYRKWLVKQRTALVVQKIFQYHDYISCFIDEFKKRTLDNLEKIIRENDKILTCADMLLELRSLPPFSKIPPILESTISTLSGESFYVVDHELISVLKQYLQIITNYVTNDNSFVIGDAVYSLIEAILNSFNELNLKTDTESCFIEIFERFVAQVPSRQPKKNSSIDQFFMSIYAILADKTSLFHRVIVSSLHYNWKCDILIECLVLVLYHRFNKSHLLVDPDYFHTSFVQLNLFLRNIEKLFFSEDQVIRFRKSSQVVQLLKLWNILAYFQTRRRFAISKVEQAFLTFETAQSLKLPDTFFDSVLSILNYCFDSNTVLPQLCGRFWGLFLQINYITFKRLKNHFNEASPTFDDIDALINAQSSLTAYWTQVTSIVESDIRSFLATNGIDRFELVNMATRDVMDAVDQLVHHINDLVLKALLEKILPLIEEAKSIPRLFINTHREDPSGPSSYITEVVDAFDSLSCNPKLGGVIRRAALIVKESLHTRITSVKEYLKKTETSFLRFQNPSSGSTQFSDAEFSSVDFIKINKQFTIDFSVLCEMLKELPILDS